MAVVAFNASSVRETGPRPSPYAKPHVLARLSGDCQVARYIRSFAKELDAQLGGSTTPAQKALIKEAAIKSAKLGLLVDKILANTEPDPDLASRCYLAWSNSLRRDLEVLGIGRPEVQTPRIAEYLAARPKKRGSAA